jgi:ABC-2 type transport system ATP-binding protein
MQIEIDRLVKRYAQHTALDIPRLEIEPGESVGLVGNNGAGKTTFLRLLLDLIEPSAGEVRIDGRRVRGATAFKRRTGSYLDAGFLIDYLTPEEFLHFIGRTYRLETDQLERRLERYAPFLGDEVLGGSRYIGDLSQGNMKKVGIAAALVVEPLLLLLDEPFAHLDPTAQIRLKEMLRALAAEGRTTMVISSHDLNHVTEVCDRIVLLERGSAVRDLQTSPATLAELEDYFSAQ